MGEEPTWAELLLGSAIALGVPTALVGAVIFSLVGLTLWATAPERRWRRQGLSGGSGPDRP
ncbi:MULTISPECIES: hypothetical protein [unclassified Streptomyces]|uniref:hypothetical protein n=1 Tax=unclassified Streptomyces TaxID=2593676 RepID=UPI0035D79456